MCNRREDDAGNDDNSQAAVKSIQARKELAAERRWRIHGTHST